MLQALTNGWNGLVNGQPGFGSGLTQAQTQQVFRLAQVRFTFFVDKYIYCFSLLSMTVVFLIMLTFYFISLVIFSIDYIYDKENKYYEIVTFFEIEL